MPISLLDVAKNFKGEPNQVEALKKLDSALKDSTLTLDNQDWVKTWRSPLPNQPHPKSKIPRQAINLIKEFEGFVPTVYDDGVGVATIGYGTTIYPNGQRVQFGDRNINEADALIYLENDTESYWDQLVRTIPYWSEMSDNQRAALLSFAYNLGAYFYGGAGFSTISRVLAEKNWSAVPKAFLSYVNPGSNVEAGLIRRRKAEGALWLA